MNLNPLLSFSNKEFEVKDSIFKDKFSQALRNGFFYVEFPEAFQMHLHATTVFARTLRQREAELKQFNSEPQVGYQVRHGTQAVSFVTKKFQWEKAYPKEIQILASAMSELALKILKEALIHFSIPQDKWNRATGELTNGQGTIVFSINHYQPGPEKIGLIPHKDMGWLTALLINETDSEMGLEAKIDDQWISIPPREGYILINFGKAFEILINDPNKLTASLHRVRQVANERISWGAFINHQEGTSICQLQSSGELHEIQTYEEYLQGCFKEFEALQKTTNS